LAAACGGGLHLFERDVPGSADQGRARHALGHAVLEHHEGLGAIGIGDERELRDFGHVRPLPQARRGRVEAGQVRGGHRGDLVGDAGGGGAQGVDGGAAGQRIGKAFGRQCPFGIGQRGLGDQGVVVGLAGEAGQGKDAALGLGGKRAVGLCAQVFDGRGPNRGERGPPARIGDDLAALALPFHQPGMVQRGDAHRVFGQVGVDRLVEETAARGAVVDLGHRHSPGVISRAGTG
jgi:hypothetical protein